MIGACLQGSHGELSGKSFSYKFLINLNKEDVF